MNSKEIWRSIKGYENLYQISNLGRVKSLARIIDKGKYGIIKINETILKSYPRTKNTYLSVTLYKNKIGKMYTIHRLVSIAFISNPENKSQINHIDCIKINNHINNLEWVTAKENMEHASKNNLIARNYGIKNGNSKLTNEYVELIRNSRYKITRKTLSEICGVSIKHIDRIRGKERWKHTT